MQTAPRWVANLAKVMGAIAWAAGVLMHFSLFGLAAVFTMIFSAGGGGGFPIHDWQAMLRLFMAALSGPGAVLVGGGLRFIGGLMSGQKVAGKHAPRILLFEWLRYELLALGAVALISCLGTGWIIQANAAWGLALFVGSIGIGIGCIIAASKFGSGSKKLMWDLREEGIRRGDVPWPADALAHTGQKAQPRIRVGPTDPQPMTSRERLAAALDHRQPDRVCVDFGATFVTGIHVNALGRLREAVLGKSDHPVKVIEPYQMLGEVDDELREALGIDVIGLLPRKSIFGTVQDNWKPFTMFDGTKCLVPGNFNTTLDENGDLLIYPEGDTSVPPSGHMPKASFFFDSIIRQPEIDEDKLDPEDNLEEFGLLGEEDLGYFRSKKPWFEERGDCGNILITPGTAFGDIALVPAPFLKDPKGIRDIEEWYVSTAMRKDYVLEVFERQCEFAEANIRTLIEIFGDTVQVALLTGTDFGTQIGPFISTEAYRELFLPFHKRLNNLIHTESNWKTFIHSCGSVYALIPHFIEAGFDILNPVQCSAAEMEPRRLKQEFGDDIVFWGGGVNTQQTIAFGTPEETYAEVRERIDIFNEDGGMVFNSIHNIQATTPTENMLAMFKAINDSA